MAQLVRRGAHPLDVFSKVIGEHTRADNPGCVINGVADHEVMNQYLRHAASKAPRGLRGVLLFLANKGEALKASREVVKRFMFIDQSTDAANHEPKRRITAMASHVNSSLGNEISRRILPDSVRQQFVAELVALRPEIAKWQQLSAQLEQLGKQAARERYGRVNESLLRYLEQGYPAGRYPRYAKLCLRTADSWIDQAIAKLSAPGITAKEAGWFFSVVMERLTAAQSVIEGQYYAAGSNLIARHAAAAGSSPP